MEVVMLLGWCSVSCLPVSLYLLVFHAFSSPDVCRALQLWLKQGYFQSPISVSKISPSSYTALAVLQFNKWHWLPPMWGASQVALVVKNPPANAGDRGDAGSIPGSGRSPGGGHGNLLQYSCLENPMDREAWCAEVHRVTQNQTWLKWLGTHIPPMLCVSVRPWISYSNAEFISMSDQILRPPLEEKTVNGDGLRFRNIYGLKEGLPWWLSGKEATCQCKRCRFDPWVGKIPWRRKWQPIPVFLPGESHGQRSLEGYSPWGSQKSWTQLNN